MSTSLPRLFARASSDCPILLRHCSPGVDRYAMKGHAHTLIAGGPSAYAVSKHRHSQVAADDIELRIDRRAAFMAPGWPSNARDRVGQIP